jgi:glucosamine-6-phosphate deaminase
VDVFPHASLAAAAAALDAATTIRESLNRRGKARIMVGTGNSQLEMIRVLTGLPGIDWSRVEAFHVDEYVGLSADHPSSFRNWMRHHFVEKVRPGAAYYVEGDAANLDAVAREYGRQLLADLVDLAFVGIGENGHIAFNDPHVADFNDVQIVKRVSLDEACRRQQVGEGHFPTLDSVPKEALTVTCSGLFRAARWICCVPDRRKAVAVRNSLEGPLSPQCPGSLTRIHPSAAVYLDTDSASLLTPGYVKAHCRVHGGNSLASTAG